MTTVETTVMNLDVTTATLTSFDVSNMDSVWTQPRPVMGYHMTAMITVMRATVHIPASLDLFDLLVFILIHKGHMKMDMVVWKCAITTPGAQYVGTVAGTIMLQRWCVISLTSIMTIGLNIFSTILEQDRFF